MNNTISNQKGLRRRSFEIIRKPELEDSSFLFNNVQVRYVATCPETGISFYVNTGHGGVTGVRVYPDGRKALENATGVKYGKPYAHGKAEYHRFRHAFGHSKGIYASHAVYIAWRNEKIPAGMTIDHIDGCTTNNDFRNLRCVSNEINVRDGGFLCKLRKSEIDPATIQRPYLLRYFDRMALLKRNLSVWHYQTKLTKDVIRAVLYLPEEQFRVDHFVQSLKTTQSCQTTLKNCAV